jgi:SAM-dependent methyltransferase
MSKVPWIPSPKIVVEYIKHALGVTRSDVVMDLGCGDGRVLIDFAKAGVSVVCIEIDRVLCNVTEIVFELYGVKDRLKLICNDFFRVNFAEIMPRPTIVYAYLYSSILEMLSPKLETELGFGTIIVTLDFPIRGWSPVFAKHLVDESNYDRVLWIYINGISNPSARIAKGTTVDINDVINQCLRSGRRLFLF